MFLFCTKEADQATATSGIRWEGICVQSEIYYKTKQIVRRYVSKSTELEKKKKKKNIRLSYHYWSLQTKWEQEKPNQSWQAGKIRVEDSGQSLE